MTNLQKTLYDSSLQRRPIAVLAACDDKYAFCLYVSLRTLVKNSPQLAQQADIWVASLGISETHKTILQTIPQVRIFEYEFPGGLEQTPAIQKFTNVSFARYELFPMLKLYKNVLYLDSDVLVQKELLPVFDLLQDGIGLIPDSRFRTTGGNFSTTVPGFDMQATGYNSGFIVMNRNGKWFPQVEAIRDFLYTTTQQFAQFLYLPDQGIINLALQRFGMHPTPLSSQYNCPASHTKELRSAYIIHCTGPRKFWCYYYFHDFYTEYTNWIQQGGKPVSIRPKNSKLYQWFIETFHLQNRVFIQLCPDMVTAPLKAARFALKKLLDFR